MEGEAAVAAAVRVAAFEAGTGIAEQEAAGRERRRPLACAVLEAAGRHRRDRYVGMTLLEAAIVRALVAHDVAHAPAGSRRHDVNGDGHAEV